MMLFDDENKERLQLHISVFQQWLNL
jgi:hypothetical protein